MKKAFTLKIRIIAASVLIVLLAVMLFSSFFVAIEADHDCQGEGCSVCLQMEQCEALLRVMSDTLISVISKLLLFMSPLLLLISGIKKAYLSSTPIERKERLND